jgi:transcriptional regulator with XRE-family HTH domain
MGKKSNNKGPTRIGEKLALIRTSFGFSQNEMLRWLRIDEEYTREEISAYERGVRVPPLHVLLRYSKTSRVWVNVLIDDELDLPSIIPAPRMSDGIRSPVKKARG